MSIIDDVANRRAAKKWMKFNAFHYDNSTALAEAFANEFDCYENQRDYPIPEWVFEVAAELGFYNEE